MSQTTEDTSREILDVIPILMRVIRSEMRSQRSARLSVPQFRVLLFISRNSGCSLLAAAEYLGLTSPTVSKMVDGLVRDHLVKRVSSSRDRRQILLNLTIQGETILEKARIATQARLVKILSPLSVPEREVVSQALNLLQPLFLARCDPE